MLQDRETGANHHAQVLLELTKIRLFLYTPGVNFVNILHTRFSYESELSSFSLIMFGFTIFWHQNIGKKSRVKC